MDEIQLSSGIGLLRLHSLRWMIGLSNFPMASAFSLMDQLLVWTKVSRVTVLLQLFLLCTFGDLFGGFRAFQLPRGATAQQAEHAALFGALLWAFSLLQSFATTNVAFHFDCLNAGYSAAGTWLSSFDNQFARANRGLWHLLEQQFAITVTAHHVAAHKATLGMKPQMQRLGLPFQPGSRPFRSWTCCTSFR